MGRSWGEPVLDALKTIGREGLAPDGERIALADGHPAPMVARSVPCEDGAHGLAARPRPVRWRATTNARVEVRAAGPDFAVPIANR